MKRVSGNNNGSAQKRQRRQQKPSKVLHVRGLPDDTTETELVEVVAPYGEVVKCLVLVGKNQAFLQMESIEASQDVLSGLENPKIRSRPIAFQFSSRSEVSVKSYEDSPKKAHRHTQQQEVKSGNIILLNITDVSLPVCLDNIYHICKAYGQVLKIVTFPRPQKFKALVQFGTVDEAVKAKKQLDEKDLFQDCCHIRTYFSERSELTVKPQKNENLPKSSRDYKLNPMALMSSSVHTGAPARTQQHTHTQSHRDRSSSERRNDGIGMGSQSQSGITTVVLVTPLVPDKISCEVLFTLFGVYGRIMKIKILYKKRQTALIQYATQQQAQSAVDFLNGCGLQGKRLTVVASRMQEIKLPKMDENEENLLTKDYTDSSLNRRRFRNVFPPSQVLHVGNLYENATEQELQDLFGGQQTIGAQEPIVEFFQSSRKMAYVCMNSVDDAVEALVNLHGSVELDDGHPLRVSFSKKDASNVRSSAHADDDSSS